MTVKVFDVSEFQGPINWGAVVDPGIIRIHNSGRPDLFYRPNITGARAHCPWRGWYQYLAAGADPVKAAHDFQAALGPTMPGEAMILDLEEGAGDQSARRAAWINALADDVEWTYSGVSFARAHLPGVKVQWLAAYGQGEPTDSHVLWQFTDAQRFAGISGPCDGSVFNGTLAQLQALTAPTPAPRQLPGKGLLDMFIVYTNAQHYIIVGGSAHVMKSVADEVAYKAAGVPVIVLSPAELAVYGLTP